MNEEQEANRLVDFADRMFFDWPIWEIGLRGFISNAFVAAIVSLSVAWFVVRNSKMEVSRFGSVFAHLLVIGLFGALVGYSGGNSREGVVGDLIPAVITLLAGAVTYLIGVSDEQTRKLNPMTLPMVATFITVLFFCYVMGAGNRVGFEAKQNSADDKEFTR